MSRWRCVARPLAVPRAASAGAPARSAPPFQGLGLRSGCETPTSTSAALQAPHKHRLTQAHESHFGSRRTRLLRRGAKGWNFASNLAPSCAPNALHICTGCARKLSPTGAFARLAQFVQRFSGFYPVCPILSNYVVPTLRVFFQFARISHPMAGIGATFRWPRVKPTIR